jgi:hypothetical protein
MRSNPARLRELFASLRQHAGVTIHFILSPFCACLNGGRLCPTGMPKAFACVRVCRTERLCASHAPRASSSRADVEVSSEHRPASQPWFRRLQRPAPRQRVLAFQRDHQEHGRALADRSDSRARTARLQKPSISCTRIRDRSASPSRVGAVSMRFRRKGEFRSWCRVSRFTSPWIRAPINSFVASVESKTGDSPPHRSWIILIGEAVMLGVAILPRNRVRTSWNANWTFIAIQVYQPQPLFRTKVPFQS